MTPYFLYAGKSTNVEDKQVLSIEAQLAELRDVAKREDLNIADEFVEKRSAKMPNRPIFNDMLRRIQAGEAQGIICWKVDRLARNPVNSMTSSTRSGIPEPRKRVNSYGASWCLNLGPA